MANDELLPIKVVFASQEDYEKPPTGGSRPKVFEPVTDALRSRFARQVGEVESYFTESFQRYPDVPVVAKVRLKGDASAKTHRPAELFNAETCPIIGATDIGELLVSATRSGLDSVQSRIKQATDQKSEANISTLKSIEPYRKEDATGGRTAAEVRARAEKGKSKTVACRLFRHPNPKANRALQTAFEELLVKNGIQEPKAVFYAEGLPIYSLGHPSTKMVEIVSSFAGAQNVCEVPEYRLVRSASRVLGNLTPEAFPPPSRQHRYGLVGIIDSGTDPNNTQLQAWVEARVDWVPRAMQNNAHGSFVAGLLVHSRRMNHGDARFPAASSRIVDVVALDRDGQISEFDLVTVIDRALTEFPQVKVWNLSLSLIGETCSDTRFSWLGAALDWVSACRARWRGTRLGVRSTQERTHPSRGFGQVATGRSNPVR